MSKRTVYRVDKFIDGKSVGIVSQGFTSLRKAIEFAFMWYKMTGYVGYPVFDMQYYPIVDQVDDVYKPISSTE